MSVLLLSPHRDDAAFSCGLLLAKLVKGCVAVRIANVCTISDYAPYGSVMDSLDPVADITHLRAAEDAAFVKHLQDDFAPGHQYVKLLDLGWKDAPLRHAIPTEDVLAGGTIPTEEVNRLAAVFRSFAPASIVLAPLAFGRHLDHRLVRQAAMDAWPEGVLVFYEDLPYACRMTAEERTEQTRSALPSDFACAETLPAQSGDKHHMAMYYSSQIAERVADEMELYGAAMGWTERLFGSSIAMRALASLPGTTKLIEGTTF